MQLESAVWSNKGASVLQGLGGKIPVNWEQGVPRAARAEKRNKSPN